MSNNLIGNIKMSIASGTDEKDSEGRDSHKIENPVDGFLENETGIPPRKVAEGIITEAKEAADAITVPDNDPYLQTLDNELDECILSAFPYIGARPARNDGTSNSELYWRYAGPIQRLHEEIFNGALKIEEMNSVVLRHIGDRLLDLHRLDSGELPTTSTQAIEAFADLSDEEKAEAIEKLWHDKTSEIVEICVACSKQPELAGIPFLMLEVMQHLNLNPEKLAQSVDGLSRRIETEDGVQRSQDKNSRINRLNRLRQKVTRELSPDGDGILIGNTVVKRNANGDVEILDATNIRNNVRSLEDVRGGVFRMFINNMRVPRFGKLNQYKRELEENLQEIRTSNSGLPITVVFMLTKAEPRSWW